MTHLPRLLTAQELPLADGEQIEWVGGIHKLVYAFGAVLVPFWGIGLLFLLAGWALQKSTELVVTSRRVVLRTGIVVPKTTEIPLHQVQSVELQGQVQRGYGNATIVGTGGSKLSVSMLAKPAELRDTIARLRTPMPPEASSVERRYA